MGSIQILNSMNDLKNQIYEKQDFKKGIEKKKERQEEQYSKFITHVNLTENDFEKVGRDFSRYFPLLEYSNFLVQYNDELQSIASEKQTNAYEMLFETSNLLLKEIEKTKQEISDAETMISNMNNQHSQLNNSYNQAVWDEQHPPETGKV